MPAPFSFTLQNGSIATMTVAMSVETNGQIVWRADFTGDSYAAWCNLSSQNTTGDALANVAPDATAEDLQGIVYDVGRAIPRYQDLTAKGATPEKPGVSNAWFQAIYEVLFGEPKGPRFGSFIALYGIAETRALIARGVSGVLVASSMSGELLEGARQNKF